LRSTLFHRAFLSLLCTQFFGAANDNILKQVLTYMVAAGLWKGILGAGGQAYVALCLTLPFILFSGFAGQVADRYSKRTVMVAVKLAEVPIALLALAGLMAQSLWLTMVAFLLLAVQSAFFGPAKYGVVPELVAERDLSRANGLLNMLTNLAVIFGTVVGGPLSDLYDPQGPGAVPVLWAPGAALLVVALLGVAAILVMPPLSPADPRLRYNFNPLHTYVQALREMYGRPLFVVALAWSFFSLVGMMGLLILVAYPTLMNITYTQNSILLAVMGVSIGVGSVLCGVISGDSIKPRFIPLGAIGMTASLALLGLLPPDPVGVGILLGGAGLFAGFYMVPLQALLQRLSPENERGRFLGAANGLSFCFGALGSVIFLLAAKVMPVNRIFLVCAGLFLLWTGFAMVGLRGYLKRHPSV
jgi:acyl-[acyl-carrier-protein]-phospholipid O-acyltransferase/long-chain-fatty-acid--[acyl-carrier-protein] ligase